MKKYATLLASLVMLSAPCFAQFEIKRNGTISLGTPCPDEAVVTTANADTITRIKIHGPYGEWGAGSRIAFGDAASKNSLGVLIGEYGTTDTDIMWLHGKHGFYLTCTPMARDIILSYDENKGDFFNFTKPIKFTEMLKPSLEINGYSAYTISGVSTLLKFKTLAHGNGMNSAESPSKKISIGGSTAKERQDDNFYNSGEMKDDADYPTFGLVADEVKAVLPWLVQKDKEGNQYVDYAAIVPVLIRAIQELKQEITDLQCAQASEELLTRALAQGNDLQQERFNGCFVGQNTPNPLTTTSTIAYQIPEKCVTAKIYFYNLQGLQVDCIDIDVKNPTGQIQIPADRFKAGIYLYALVADGTEIATKRMIVAY